MTDARRRRRKERCIARVWFVQAFTAIWNRKIIHTVVIVDIQRWTDDAAFADRIYEANLQLRRPEKIRPTVITVFNSAVA